MQSFSVLQIRVLDFLVFADRRYSLDLPEQQQAPQPQRRVIITFEHACSSAVVTLMTVTGNGKNFCVVLLRA